MGGLRPASFQKERGHCLWGAPKAPTLRWIPVAPNLSSGLW